jgi:hypothetical protein
VKKREDIISSNIDKKENILGKYEKDLAPKSEFLENYDDRDVKEKKPSTNANIIDNYDKIYEKIKNQKNNTSNNLDKPYLYDNKYLLNEYKNSILKEVNEKSDKKSESNIDFNNYTTKTTNYESNKDSFQSTIKDSLKNNPADFKYDYSNLDRKKNKTQDSDFSKSKRELDEFWLKDEIKEKKY